jgi:membrane protease YdiL (CAAX protease family)
LFGFYALFLSTSVVYGIASQFGTEAVDTEATLRERLGVMGVLEAIDAVLVGLAIATVARPGWRRPTRRGVRAATWLLALPALAAVLWMNHTYHDALIEFARVERVDTALVEETGLTLPVILTHCVQPAIVEELFFRYLILGMLLRVMGAPSAVAVSSMMFGLAHVGVPLSIPMLSVIGVFLAVARLGSGGMALPIALHFLHNLAVLYRDGVT